MQITSWRRRLWIFCALVSLLLPVGVSAPTDAPSAIARFQDLQVQLKKARADRNWSSYLDAAKRFEIFLNHSPGSLLELARAEVQTGDVRGAGRTLDKFARMGQSTELLAKLPDFLPLRNRKQTAKLLEVMTKNRAPISQGSVVSVMPDAQLLAEDIDFDPVSARFLITSVLQQKIIAVDRRGASRDFARSPDGWPMLAVKVDTIRGVVWATEVALQGSRFAPQKDLGRSAIVCFDLKTGVVTRRIEGPAASAPGDLKLMKNGDVIVSDGDAGAIYRIRGTADKLERMDGGDFLSPQTTASDPDEKHLFVPDYVRGIAVLDLDTKRVRWLATEGRFALDGVDGLYFDKGRLIAVQNGTTPARIVVFTLNRSLDRIVSEKVIERSMSALDPTHGVVIDDDFYYIFNSGWHAVNERGDPVPGVTLSAPEIRRMKLLSK